MSGILFYTLEQPDCGNNYAQMLFLDYNVKHKQAAEVELQSC